MEELLKECKQAVLKGEKERAVKLAQDATNKGIDPLTIIEQGFALGIREAGELWERGEYFLPELAFSAEAMKAAMEVLKPSLLASKEDSKAKAKIVIGTIQGDIHDIGKTLVATLLSANGYDVVDLGADVPYNRFVDESAEQKAGFICMSALLTTTMPGQGEVIRLLEEKGMRKNIKVLVGGAPANAAWAKEIGADGYADNAVAAVQVINSFLQP
jgi:corrinoid protein of di/trimethylamine methyltransferase